MKRLPVITLSIVLLSMVVTLWSNAADWLIYDRQAIAGGEVWRLLTGHLVHLSLLHLAGDLVVFGLAGSLIERRLGNRVLVLYLGMALVISLMLLSFDPDLLRFGGLSGLAYGCLFYLGLQHRDCLFGRALAAVIVIKLIGDLFFVTSLISWVDSHLLIPVPLSHLAGVLTAGTAFLLTAKEHEHVTV